MRQVQAVDEDSGILGQPASPKPEKTIHGAGVPGWEAIAHLRGNHDAGVYQETHGEVSEGSCLQFPLPVATASSGHRPLHKGGLRPGATTGTAASQADAIKLRPSQPIRGYIQCFPPRAKSGRGGREAPGSGGSGGGAKERAFWGRGLIRDGLAKRGGIQLDGLRIP